MAPRATSARDLPARAEVDADVVVIGGGVNGTGVARDLSLRGARVVLFEKTDFAFGASGNSSGMIHGGPRYLTKEPSVTRTSSEDAGHIQRIAPHLVFRIPFLVPIERRGPRSKILLAAADAFFAFYDRFQPLKGGKPHALLTAAEARALEPGLGGELEGAVSFDEWGIDGARLCVLNAIDAEEHGATVHVRTEVIGLLREGADGPIRGVVARDRETGERRRVRARLVVNAAGAWTPSTSRLAGERAEVKVRPGKGIHVVFDRRLSNYAIAARAIDGRQVFYMPWQNVSYLGTTDDDFYGDLDECRATTDEVRYLIEGVARAFPEVARARVIGTTAGARNTLHAWGRYEDELSREHEILDHAAVGAPGLFSMIGGKLASYRIFAAEMADRCAAILAQADGAPLPSCSTHTSALPGGDAPADPSVIAAHIGVSPHAAARIAYRHGSRSELVQARVKRRSRERAVVCSCEPVLEAEIRHAVAVEHARDLSDVARRTRCGLGQCGGMRCAQRAAAIVADERELGPQAAHAMAARFLVERWRARLPALEGPQLAQEELHLQHVLLGSGLGEGALRAAREKG